MRPLQPRSGPAIENVLRFHATGIYDDEDGLSGRGHAHGTARLAVHAEGIGDFTVTQRKRVPRVLRRLILVKAGSESRKCPVVSFCGNRACRLYSQLAADSCHRMDVQTFKIVG